MKKITVKCPNCDKKHQVDESDLGALATCDACNLDFTLREEIVLMPSRSTASEKKQSLDLDDLRKLLACTPVMVRIDSADLKDLKISEIDMTIGNMINLVFKFMVAMILVNLILVLPLFLVLMILNLIG